MNTKHAKPIVPDLTGKIIVNRIVLIFSVLLLLITAICVPAYAEMSVYEAIDERDGVIYYYLTVGHCPENYCGMWYGGLGCNLEGFSYDGSIPEGVYIDSESDSGKGIRLAGVAEKVGEYHFTVTVQYYAEYDPEHEDGQGTLQLEYVCYVVDKPVSEALTSSDGHIYLISDTEAIAAEPQYLTVDRSGTNEVHVSTTDEFLAAIASDTTVYIDVPQLDLTAASNYGVGWGSSAWNSCNDGYELVIKGVRNFNIVGGEIVTQPRSANVLTFESCFDISLEDLRLGHTEGNACGGGVLCLRATWNILLDSCDLYGCGTHGIIASYCSGLQVQNTRIHDCSASAGWLYNVNGAVFLGCEVANCPKPHFAVMSGCSNISWDGVIQDSDTDFNVGDCSENIIDTDIGDTVLFGKYEQDNDISNGREDIEWLVLDKKDNMLLVVSKYALDAGPYNTEYEDATWENCTLRTWLNSEFLNEAFSAEDLAKICTVQLTNEYNPEYGSKGGKNTEDKIFLLSLSEAQKYFDDHDHSARMCAPTDYAILQLGYDSVEEYNIDFEYFNCLTEYASDARCAFSWWLRTPDHSQDGAYFIFYNGDCYCTGFFVGIGCDYSLCIRPAMWIKLDS